MLAGIRSRLTYANVMASIAVFIALGAGAYAAGLAPDSVKSKHIVDGQVKTEDLNVGAKSRWALVNKDGTIIKQSGGISVDYHDESGTYILDLGKPVDGKAILASVAYEGADDLATAHASPCGDNGDKLQAGCDSLVPGADTSGTHVVVFSAVQSGVGGNEEPFYVAVLP